MEQMKSFIEWIETIKIEQIREIIFAIGIFLLFKILSRSLAYITIRILKPRTKSKKIIKSHPFYLPLRAFYIVLGIYFGILCLKHPLMVNEKIIIQVHKLFRISIIILIANAIANSMSINSNFIKKIKNKFNPDLEDAMFKFILKSIKVIIYIIASFLVITELGYNLNGLVAGLGIGSVVITLAAQDTAKNLFGGVVVFLDKPFSVGDWIEIQSYEGTVEDITFRSTRVRTFENSVVNIPNSIIANESIVNWSRMQERRNKINLCLELDTPLEKIQVIQNRIKEMLIQHDDIIDDTIIVKFDNIIDNGINLLIYTYTNSINYISFLEEKEKINYKILQILREEHVELAYDTKTVYVKK